MSLSLSSGYPIREAVEAQPPQVVKALARIADFIAREATCQENSYISVEGSCRDYMWCVHGKLQLYSCPPNLYWNNSAKICHYPYAVDCKEDGVVQPHVVESSSQSLVTQAPISTTTQDWNKPWAPPTPPPRPDYDNLPLTNGLSGDYKIVCYFTNWATYRQGGDGKFDPEDIDPKICTHIIYGFAVLDQNTLLLKSHDPYADMSDGELKVFLQLFSASSSKSIS